jgi:hypothetical protein
MSEHDQSTRPSGRTLSVYAYGDTAEQMELMALDKARAFFGTDVRLDVVRDYAVFAPMAEPHLTCCAELGVAHMASIKVQVIEA